MNGVRVVARVLIMSDAGELLLCRNRTGKAWVPPGGTIEPGETLSEAAAREAEEEVGLTVEVGRLLYLQEFKPAGRQELVIEAAFQARPTLDRPADALAAARRIEPGGDHERPWASWYIVDVDGPRREVRWFTREALAAVPEPVYPTYLQTEFWQALQGSYNPYLGLTRG